MQILRNKSLKIILFIFLGLLLSVVILQWRAEYMVKDFLDRKIPKHLSLSYGDLDVNIISGNIEFAELSLKASNRDSAVLHTNFTASNLIIEDFEYIPFFFNKTIAIYKLSMENPMLNYYPYKYVPVKKTKREGIVNLLKTISIDEIALKRGSLYLMKQGKDSIAVALKNYDFELLGGKTDPELITAKIPISYTDYSFNGTDIFADLGKFEELNIMEIDAFDNTFQINDISLESKYDKLELSKHISIERDYVNLKIPVVIIEGFDFGFKEDKFGITITSGKMEEPNLKLFRDKRMPDDTSKKALYRELLRELPINLMVENFSIQNGYVAYEEKVTDKNEAGLLFFKSVTANISNISNTGGIDLSTEVKTASNVMGSGKLQLDWEFNIADQNDAFTASGSLTNLLAENLNPFLEPNLRTRAKGRIDEMYFTFSGNSIGSKGNLKMKYHDFKFQILNKDRLRINKFLTSIGNLFISDGSRTDEKGFRHGTIDVNRANDKSFFNYLWINLENGIVSTLTGNGKKDERK